jgi:hypothetical protein
LLARITAFGKAIFPPGGNSADMIGVEMCQEDVIDLLGPVSRNAQIFDEMSATDSVECAGAAAD